jgi:hypothetical protein
MTPVFGDQSNFSMVLLRKSFKNTSKFNTLSRRVAEADGLFEQVTQVVTVKDGALYFQFPIDQG